MTARPESGDALRRLLTPEAVRERANELYELALAGETPHFQVFPDKLTGAADLVAEVTRAAYPDLVVPVHSRWRHFELPGRNLWAELQAATQFPTINHCARVRFELAIVSVLLDAGAVPPRHWREALFRLW